jgi:hypothetical protein
MTTRELAERIMRVRAIPAADDRSRDLVQKTLHLAVDAASGMIVARTLTDQNADDPSQVGSLLDQIDEPIGQVTADGAYDGSPTYQTIAAHGDGIEVVIPPRSTAVASGEPGPLTQRDSHLAMIAEKGRLAWPGHNRLRLTVLSRNYRATCKITLPA